MRQFLKHYLPKDTRATLLKAERLLKLLVRPKVMLSLHRYNKLKKEKGDERFSTNLKDIFPITGEDTKYTSFDRHYVYHTAWAARVVKEIAEMYSSNPDFRHIDVASSLYFCGIVSTFVPIDFYDYRPADLRLDGLTTEHGDLLALPFEDNSVDSISCMHTIEHIGLGRYGDPLDPEGDLKAISELCRVVKPNGSLMIVVPVGAPRIEFNAHRIYLPTYIKNIICDEHGFDLKEYAYIPETDREGGLERDVTLVKGSTDRYACGCFWFIKKTSGNKKETLSTSKDEEKNENEGESENE